LPFYINPVLEQTLEQSLGGEINIYKFLLILFFACFPMASYYLYHIWKIRRWENKVLPKNGIEIEKHLSVVYMCAAVILMQLDLRGNDLKKSKMLLAIAEITPNYAEVADNFSSIWKKQVGISHLSKWMNLRLNHEERANVVYFLIEISYIDGVLLAKEFNVIEDLALSVGITPKELRQMIASHKQRLYRERAQKAQQNSERRKKKPRKSQRERAFEILGISSHASRDEIKKTYRTLVKKYHPDRFVGKSTREMETAENRFIEIQKAYDLINETS